MSNTPKSDSECYSCTDPCSEWHGEWVPLEIASQLERELTLQKRHTEVINRTLRATLGMEDGRDCWDEIQRLKEGAARYEYLRKLNPREFAALTLFCNTSGIHFDAEVDRRRSTP